MNHYGYDIFIQICYKLIFSPIIRKFIQKVTYVHMYMNYATKNSARFHKSKCYEQHM